MDKKPSERMRKLIGNEWPDEVAALEAKLEAMERLRKAVVTWVEFDRRRWELSGPDQIEFDGYFWEETKRAALAVVQKEQGE